MDELITYLKDQIESSEADEFGDEEDLIPITRKEAQLIVKVLEDTKKI